MTPQSTGLDSMAAQVEQVRGVLKHAHQLLHDLWIEGKTTRSADFQGALAALARLEGRITELTELWEQAEIDMERKVDADLRGRLEVSEARIAEIDKSANLQLLALRQTWKLQNEPRNLRERIGLRLARRIITEP